MTSLNSPAIEQPIRRLKRQRVAKGLFYSPTEEIMDDMGRNRLRATLLMTLSEAVSPAPRSEPDMMVNTDGQRLYFDLESAASPRGAGRRIRRERNGRRRMTRG